MDIEEYDCTHNLHYEYSYSMGKFSLCDKVSDIVVVLVFWTNSEPCWYMKNNSENGNRK